MVLAVTSPARQEQGEVFEQNGRPLVENANKSQLKQPRAREITSRYKSPSTTTTTPTPTTSSRSSTPSRRFPSPLVGRASNGAEAGKRASSVERRRLDSPGGSSTDSRASRGTSTPKSNSSNASSQRIWPSAQKLSMSMQAEPKLEREKQEKLMPNGDHSLKPTATNGVHKGSESPSRLRKPTPERKATPERRSTPVRRLSSEQAENAKPKGDFNRFSSSPRTGLSRSMDFSSEKEKSGNRGAASLVVQGRAVSCATRTVKHAPPIRSLTKSVNEGPLPDSPQSISRTMLSESRGRTKLEPEKIEPTGAIASLQQADDAFRHFPDEAEFTSLVSHPSLDTSDCESISSSGSAATVKTTRSAGKLRPSLSEQDFSAAIASTGRRLRSLSVSSGSISTASWSLSPGRLSSTSQPPSPSKSVSSSSSPFRGMASPTRTRVSPFQLPPNNRLSTVSSLLNFPIRGGKKALGQQEEAQSFRLLHNRWLQWRFVNARAEAARNSQKASVERSICNAWLQISELRKSVAMKRIKLQQARGIWKLQQILSSQGPLLETWAALQPEHSAALSGSLDSLESAVLRVPVTGGAKADVVAIREALGFSVDVTASLATPLHNLMPKIEKMDELVSELAEVTRQEKALLSDCSGLLDTIAGLEVEARSLQTHFVQVGGEKTRPSRKPQLTVNTTG